VPRVLQVHGDQFGDRRFVFDNENTAWHVYCSPWAAEFSSALRAPCPRARHGGRPSP
jgi:hypothetical protein